MLNSLWTSEEIASATGGKTYGRFAATGVSIDSRSLVKGDLFLPLKDKRDGHDFIPQALTKGASGFMTSRHIHTPHVFVADVEKALNDLAIFARNRVPDLQSAAVTGSVGKTTVTQAIAEGLKYQGFGHASVRSYNNHIGVPLSLARMPPQTKRAVFEIGMNHAGEIGPLSRMVQPDIAVITTIGPVHTENFPEGEIGIAKAKAEIFEGLKAGGFAILNRDNEWYGLLAECAKNFDIKLMRFGLGPDCEARLVDFSSRNNGQKIRADICGDTVEFVIRQSGPHWRYNSLAILLTLKLLGVDREAALAGLTGFDPLPGRGLEHDLAPSSGAVRLIDESYNANPLSVATVIQALGLREVKGRRLVVLTDMLELGPEASRCHKELARVLAEAKIDQVFCAGPLMRHLWDALPESQKGAYAPHALTLVETIWSQLQSGDVILVKGSKGSLASTVVDGLIARNGMGNALSSL